MFEISIQFQMFVAMEAMTDAGIKLGIPRDLALQMAAHTLHVRFLENFPILESYPIFWQFLDLEVVHNSKFLVT